VVAAGTVALLGALLFGYSRWAKAQVAWVDVYDGFETRELSNLWDTGRFVRGAVTMQRDFARAGRGAAKIVLRSGAMFEAGIKGSKDSERAELLEAERFVSREGITYEYSFSQFLPADFPIVPTRLVLAQWKQDCNGHAPCNDDSPVVAVRYTSGVLQITHQTGPHRQVLFESRDSLPGRWTDYRFQIRFTPRDDGAIRCWLNGRQVIDYQGVTAYQENAATGYASPSRFYFKMGLYRDLMDTPMTIYIDEYRKKQLPAAATAR
jgi:hypothetical protein